MNFFFFLKYQLYLLQLENYELVRFWPLLVKKGYLYSTKPLRGKLDWTQKAKALLLMALTLYVVLSLLLIIASELRWLVTVAVILFFPFAMPIFYSIALVLIYPLEILAKKFVIDKARKLICDSKNTKIIGIAGSYGKTTMKNVLSTVLSEKYKVLSTPESVNTPLGIATWINEKFHKNIEVLIIEMGEHYRGDIRYLCSITPPDIAVVTGINESHLQRMKDLKGVTDTIFEIVQNMDENGVAVLNGGDKNVINNYERYVKEGNGVVFYGESNKTKGKIGHKKFDRDKLCWTIEIDGETFNVHVLGEYIAGIVTALISIAEYLNLSKSEIATGIAKIKPVKHRLEPIHGSGNTLIIDDSYNGNPDGVEAALNLLSQFSDRRKIYITPGLVESGSQSKKIHEKIGRQLANVADLVILVKNSVTPFIEHGLKESGFDVDKIIWFNTALEAHQSLSKILKPDDVILFQNDWGDQYL